MGKSSFPPSFKVTHSSIDQRRLNYTWAEQHGHLVLWYTKESLCDSFNTFQKQDYFILSSQTAGGMKDLSIIFYLLPAFNSCTLFPFHLLSNLSPLKDFYLYLLWHLKGFFFSSFDVMRVVSNQSLWDERHPHSSIKFKTKKEMNILISLLFLK